MSLFVQQQEIADPFVLEVVDRPEPHAGPGEVRVRVRAAGVDPMAVRLALLDGHYRADREWTGGRLPAAGGRLARWRSCRGA